MFFLLNAAICWGAVVPPGHDAAAVFENRIDMAVVVVVVKPENRPDVVFLFFGVICSDGLNWYVYCENNPLKFVDKTGLRSGAKFDEATGEAYQVDANDLENTVLTAAQNNPNYIDDDGENFYTCRIVMIEVLEALGFDTSLINQAWNGMNDDLNEASQQSRGNRSIISLGRGEGALAQERANNGELVIAIMTSRSCT